MRRVMLAKPRRRINFIGAWCEPKYTGTRVLVFVNATAGAKFYTHTLRRVPRNRTKHINIDEAFPTLKDGVLDCVLLDPDQGGSLCIFDTLQFNEEMTMLPLRTRRDLLELNYISTPNTFLAMYELTPTLELAEQFLAKSVRIGYSGVIVKNLYHPYLEGSTTTWAVLERKHQMELMTLGIWPGANGSALTLILLGIPDTNGEWLPMCRAVYKPAKDDEQRLSLYDVNAFNVKCTRRFSPPYFTNPNKSPIFLVEAIMKNGKPRRARIIQSLVLENKGAIVPTVSQDGTTAV